MKDVKVAFTLFSATLAITAVIFALTFIAVSLPWWAGVILLLGAFFGFCYGVVKWGGGA